MKKIITCTVGILYTALVFSQSLCGDWIGAWSYRDPRDKKNHKGRTVVRITQSNDNNDEYSIRIKEEYGDDYGETYYWPHMQTTSTNKQMCLRIDDYDSDVTVNRDKDITDSVGSWLMVYSVEFELRGGALVMHHYYELWECYDTDGTQRGILIQKKRPTCCIRKWRPPFLNNEWMSLYLYKNDDKW